MALGMKETELPELAQKGIALYEAKFKRKLEEGGHIGEAIALHVDTED